MWLAFKKHIKDFKEKPYFDFLKKITYLLLIFLLFYFISQNIELIKRQAAHVWETSPTVYSSLLTGFSGVAIACFTISKQRKLSREKNSLDFCAAYKHSSTVCDAWEEIMILRARLKKIEKCDLTIHILSQDDKKFINLLLNEWERCANAIRSNLYEGDFLYHIYAATLLGLYRDFNFVIEYSQNRNPKYYCNFVWLCHQWSERRAKEIEKGNIREIKKEQSGLRSHILENIKHIDKNSV